MDNREQLRELGLSQNEIEIYIILLQHGTLQAGDISKKTELNRTTTYQVLDKLMAKGLVNFVQRGKIKNFQAVSPQRLVTLQQERVNLAQELAPHLERMAAPVQEKVTVYTGRRGVRTILQQILHYKKYVSFGSSGDFLEIMKHDFLLFQKEKKKRKIHSRVILGHSSKRKQIVQAAHAQFKFIDDKYMAPTTTWVFGDNTAIVVWSQKPIVTLIENSEVAKAYTSYFELLWNSA